MAISVPFSPAGDLQHHPSISYGTVDGKSTCTAPTWKETYEFQDILEISDLEKSRNASYFVLKSKKNKLQYPAFLQDILYMIANSNARYGAIHGRWTFVKRGSNYGIVLVEEVNAQNSAEDLFAKKKLSASL